MARRFTAQHRIRVNESPSKPPSKSTCSGNKQRRLSPTEKAGYPVASAMPPRKNSWTSAAYLKKGRSLPGTFARIAGHSAEQDALFLPRESLSCCMVPPLPLDRGPSSCRPGFGLDSWGSVVASPRPPHLRRRAIRIAITITTMDRTILHIFVRACMPIPCADPEESVLPIWFTIVHPPLVYPIRLFRLTRKVASRSVSHAAPAALNPVEWAFLAWACRPPTPARRPASPALPRPARRTSASTRRKSRRCAGRRGISRCRCG